MKKIMFILIFLMFSFNLYCADAKYRLKGVLISGTSTFFMMQKKDSWEANRIIEYSTYTIVNYQVGYTSTTADNFWNVILSTTNWNNSQDINYK